MEWDDNIFSKEATRVLIPLQSFQQISMGVGGRGDTRKKPDSSTSCCICLMRGIHAGELQRAFHLWNSSGQLCCPVHLGSAGSQVLKLQLSESVNAELTALFRSSFAPGTHPALPLDPHTAVSQHLPVLSSSHWDSRTWHTCKSQPKEGTRGPLGSPNAMWVSLCIKPTSKGRQHVIRSQNILSPMSGHLSQESAAHCRQSSHRHGDGTAHGLFSSCKANMDSTACIATAKLSSTLTSKPCPNMTCEIGPGTSCQKLY